MHDTGASFLILHHAGWTTGREKGSIALRAKCDIVAGVTLKDEDKNGTRITFKCFKNRGGKKWPEFKVWVVAVPGTNEPTIGLGHEIVDGFNAILERQSSDIVSKEDKDINDLVAILAELGGGATFTELKNKMQAKFPRGGWSETNFRRRLNIAEERNLMIRGGGKGELWRLASHVVPATQEGISTTTFGSQSLPPTISTHRGGDGGGGNNDRQSPPNNSHGGNGGNASESRGLQNQVEYDEQTDAEFEGAPGNDPASMLDTAAEQLVKKKG